MAGNYMDAPNSRIAWDRDGSLFVTITGGGDVTNHPASVRRQVNSEDEAGITLPTLTRIAVLFPIPMDLTAFFFATTSTSSWTVETSKDTTNGVDGTWDGHFLNNMDFINTVKPSYRVLDKLTYLQTNSSSSEIRGLRFTTVSGSAGGLLRAIHIYGTPSTLATTDRLAIWHPTADTKVAPNWFDWGNVPRGSSADKTFRIKNLSAALNANDIDIYVEALTPGTPSVASMHTLSDNGGSSFLSSLTLSSLAPGEVSPLLIIRRTVPSNAQVSVWSARLAADVNQWLE